MHSIGRSEHHIHTASEIILDAVQRCRTCEAGEQSVGAVPKEHTCSAFAATEYLKHAERVLYSATPPLGGLCSALARAHMGAPKGGIIMCCCSGFGGKKLDL